MICMIYTIYDTYLLQFDFHPVAVVGKLYENSKEPAICKWRNKTKTQNTRNRKQTYKTGLKNSPQPLFDYQTVHPVASRYTDYAKYLLTS